MCFLVCLIVERFPFPKQGVNNFVQYKFSHLPSKERQTIMELAKMFLNQINYWQLETPSQRRQRVPNDDVAGYKANYTRYASCSCVCLLHLLFFYRAAPVLQVALLLQRASVLRQPAAVRDHADLRTDAAALGVHCHEEAAPRAGQAGEGQAAARETHAHPHTLS